MLVILVFFLVFEEKSVAGFDCQKVKIDDCGNGYCVIYEFQCDAENDCGNFKDEQNCEFGCRKGLFDCGNGICVSDAYRCDGENDCGNLKDERNCDSSIPKLCLVGLFQCVGDGHCIPNSWRCDGEHHCDDGSDEHGCVKGTRCDGFKCKDQHCIPKHLKCDGQNDCIDGFDEEYCSKACEDYTCPVSGECISWSKVCNGEHNCGDETDEGPLCATSCSGTCAHKCQKTPNGAKCSCNEGFVLSNDGKTCEDANKCNTPGRCSQFCNNTKDDFKCSCAEGYVLKNDQRTCKAVGEDAYLAYVVGGGIRGMALATNYYHRRVYVAWNFESVINMDYDAAERTFFWAEQKQRAIYSISMDSTEPEVLFKTDQEPVLLRRDWITKNIYYTTEEESIVCCNANGSYCISIIANVSSHIRCFDIAPNSAFMFWIRDNNTGSGVIEKANMDGSFREVIVSGNIVSPTAMAVDPVLEAIYWCDAELGIIESTDFNGFRRRKIVDQLRYPNSLAVFEDYIYWSESTTQSVIRCDKFSGKDLMIILPENQHIRFLLIAHKATQLQGENRCEDYNCPQLCLPTATGFVCKCDNLNSTNTLKCERGSSPENQSCSEDYCFQNADCFVKGGRYVCSCPVHFAGERCEKSLLHNINPLNESHPLWFVVAALIVISVCLLITTAFFYIRHRRKSTELHSTVQYINTVAFEESCDTTEKFGRQDLT